MRPLHEGLGHARKPEVAEAVSEGQKVFQDRFAGKVLLLTGSASAVEGELMGFGGATACEPA